jgi:hypothetical protein
MVVYFPDVDTHVFYPFWCLRGEAGKHDWSVIWVLLKGVDDGAAEARRCAASHCYEDHYCYDTARPLDLKIEEHRESVFRISGTLGLLRPPQAATTLSLP